MTESLFIALAIVLGFYYLGLVYFITRATNELRKIREKLEERK